MGSKNILIDRKTNHWAKTVNILIGQKKLVGKKNKTMNRKT
jgi:hypothetical protein